jgi:hypothetical protein
LGGLVDDVLLVTPDKADLKLAEQFSVLSFEGGAPK